MKVKLYSIIVVSIISTLFYSCIDEIEIFKGENASLVIDGTLTNDPGGQRVRLYFSKAFNSEIDYSKVEGATVKIVDELGFEEPLQYFERGIYQTSEFYVGQIGKTYHVEVTLKDGKRYRSKPETMLPVPSIDSAYHVREGINLDYYINYQDEANVENYYKWRYEGTYEVIAPVAQELLSTYGPIPGSKSCYSWTVLNIRKTWRCWVKDFDSEFLSIDSDKLYDGKQVSDFKVASVLLDKKYDRGYSMELKQYSLTKEAHKYWNSLKEQMENNGTIFETTNYQIKGNVYSEDDENEQVLGYFGVSAVSKIRLFTYDFIGSFAPMSCEANNTGCLPERCLDCRRFSSSSSNEAPAFWPN